jgi:hypothetical protein
MTGLVLDPTEAEAAAENAEFTLADAEAAYSGVSALVELLNGCQPGHQITGIFIRSLLEDVRAHLENVVGGLSPVVAAELCHGLR